MRGNSEEKNKGIEEGKVIEGRERSKRERKKSFWMEKRGERNRNN